PPMDSHFSVEVTLWVGGLTRSRMARYIVVVSLSCCGAGRKSVPAYAWSSGRGCSAPGLSSSAAPWSGQPGLPSAIRSCGWLRSADLACDDFFWPEPPLRLPPPDCLLTVAQARASASLPDTPLRS